MVLNIKNAEADRLARELATATGETLTETVIVALRNRLATVHQQHDRTVLMAEVSKIQAFVRSLPDQGTRAADEITGYDEAGRPD